MWAERSDRHAGWYARWAGASAAVLLGTACVQGPNYVRPAVEVPAQYRHAELPSAAQALPADAWWHAMGDRQLDNLVEQALAHNRDLKVAIARVDEFAAILAGTASQAHPQVGYAISGNGSRASEQKIPEIVDPVSSTFTTLLSASWEIDLWGRIRRETEAARANLLATEEARRGVELTLVASVIAGYATLLELDERLKVAKANVEGRARWVKLFRARLEKGYISDFEMMQAQAEYEATLATLPTLEQAIAVQENALSVLVGRNPGSIGRGGTLGLLRFPQIPGGIPSELLARRPDILQAEQKLIASNALIGAARALYFPRISLTTFAGFASGALRSLFSGPARTWSFTGDVAGPIYTGGGITAANRQAEARRDQALAGYDKVIQDAFADVDNSLASVRTSGELEDTLARQVQSLQEATRLASLRYDNGYSDYLDLLDSERGLLNAQLSLAEARGDRHRAVVSLYRALGGDWALRPETASR